MFLNYDFQQKILVWLLTAHHYWVELVKLGYDASFHSPLHFVAWRLGHMMHVLTYLAHFTAQLNWIIMGMLLILVSVTPIVVYLVRYHMFFIQYFDMSFILPYLLRVQQKLKCSRSRFLNYKNYDHNDHNHNWQREPNLYYHWTNGQWRKYANSSAIFEQSRKDYMH